MPVVELIGCTGAGKSTLTRHILQYCQVEGVNLSLGEDYLLSRFGFGHIGNPRGWALLVNLFSLTIAWSHWRKFSQYLNYSYRIISALPISLHQKLYLFRNILKCIGIYENASSHAKDNQIVLLDEGPVNTANLLFVQVAKSHAPADLSRFIKVVPFPDVVVYLPEHEDILVQRILDRGHKRIKNGIYSDAQQFVQHADAIFEMLALEDEVQSRLIIVNGDQVSTPASKRGDPFQNFVLNLLETSMSRAKSDVEMNVRSIRHKFHHHLAETATIQEEKS